MKVDMTIDRLRERLQSILWDVNTTVVSTEYREEDTITSSVERLDVSVTIEYKRKKEVRNEQSTAIRSDIPSHS